MSCPLCESNVEQELVTAELRYDYRGTVRRCSSCSLEYLLPPMSAEEERRFYEEEYGSIFVDEKGTSPAALFEKQTPDAHRYLEWCKDHLRPTDRCLEIGCASGYFLDVLRPLVASVEGCESHHLLRDHHCTGLVDVAD